MAADEFSIAGFMVIRNGLRNGYPFLEAIRSVLPLCDEVVISEGFSEDGTFELLERFARAHPKVRIRRDAWDMRPEPRIKGGGAPIRRALNGVKKELTAPWLFQFDANDIVPARSVPILRELPRVYPFRELFGLPYRQLMGRYWFNEEFRFRLVRNRPTIRVLYDGWTMGYHLEITDLLSRRELRRLASRTAVAVLQDRIAVGLPEMYVDLPVPIYRYHGIYPEPFVEKMATKVSLQRNEKYLELARDGPGIPSLLDAYRSTGDYDAFWRQLLERIRTLVGTSYEINKEVRFVRFLPQEEHPAEIRPFLGVPRYLPSPDGGTESRGARDPGGAPAAGERGR